MRFDAHEAISDFYYRIFDLPCRFKRLGEFLNVYRVLFVSRLFGQFVYFDGAGLFRPSLACVDRKPLRSKLLS